MSRSMAAILQIPVYIIFIILGIIFACNQMRGALIITTVIAIAVILALNYCRRCRNCGRVPGRGDFFGEYCPRCGNPYEE